MRGEDRYETAAILATRAEDALQDTVYLCAGDGYSDQAAAASVGDGVILLARRDNDTVPRATLSWLHSHQPSRVIPVGGRTAVTTGAYLAAREAAGIE